MEESALIVEQPAINEKKFLLVILAIQLLVAFFIVVLPLGGLLLTLGGLVFISLLFILPYFPQIGFPLMIITSGLDFLSRFDLPWVTVTLFQVAWVTTFLFFIGNTLLRRRSQLPSTELTLPLLTFFLIISFSMIYTPNIEPGLLEFARTFCLSLLVLMAVSLINEKKDVYWIAMSFLLITVFVSMVAAFQVTTNRHFLPTGAIKALGRGMYRAEGTFANPNTFAAFIMCGVVISFTLFLNLRTSRIIKAILLGSVGLAGFALVVSFSRGGWVSTLVAIIVILFLSHKPKLILISLFVIVLGGVLLYFFFPYADLVLFRLTSIFQALSEASSSSRVYLVISGLWMFMDHPFFGVGFRGHPEVYEHYRHPHMPVQTSMVREAHTLPVEILAELGIIGFMVATWLFWTILREGLQGIKTIQDNFLKTLQIGFTALFIGFQVNFLFASDMVNNLFWITIGMIFAINRVDQKTRKEVGSKE